MYGLPDTAALSKVVGELTLTHTRTVGEHTGQEPALLALLEQAISADTSGASGGAGRSRTGAPVDVTALALWTEITQCIGDHWPGRGDLAQAKTHPIRRLQLWAERVADTEDEWHLLEMCDYWHSQIRDLLEPPKQTALQGVACPVCKTDKIAKVDEDGGRSYGPILLVHLSETPVRAECLACAGTWFGGQLVDLGKLAAPA